MLETPRVIVRFAAGNASDRKTVLARHSLSEIGGDGLPANTVRAVVLSGNARDLSLAVMMQDLSVVYAEPDFVEHIGQRYTPNDPEFDKQWHHKKIELERAWDHANGADISIAVIDNGFHTHPDIVPGRLSAWYRSTADYIDADFVFGTTNMPKGRHGTQCAGMVSGQSGNGSGGCGVAFRSHAHLIACAADQIATQTTLASARPPSAARPSTQHLARAEKKGVDIISCSLGPNQAAWSMSQTLREQINIAASPRRRDATGEGVRLSGLHKWKFPIGLDEVCSHPQVMAVGRSTQDDDDDSSG